MAEELVLLRPHALHVDWLDSCCAHPAGCLDSMDDLIRHSPPVLVTQQVPDPPDGGVPLIVGAAVVPH